MDKCDLTEVLDRLDSITEILEFEARLNVDLTECNANAVTNQVFSGSGLEGMHQGFMGLLQKLNLIQNSICNIQDPVLAMPDYYGLRPGANRPVLLLIFKEKSNNKWGAGTYSTQIFYPKESAIISIFDAKNRPKARYIGENFASLRLSDGSKIQAIGKSSSDAYSYLTYLVSFINCCPYRLEK
ncbi:MAG: hypothetical protein EBE86_010020 [Hormoscilla sp. GUM202]|nr:hypothetical protein [Hormoscilla sp. GUM202]